MPIPTRELRVSKLSKPDSIFNDVAEELAKFNAVAFIKEILPEFKVNVSELASPTTTFPFTVRLAEIVLSASVRTNWDESILSILSELRA